MKLFSGEVSGAKEESVKHILGLHRQECSTLMRCSAHWHAGSLSMYIMHLTQVKSSGLGYFKSS